MIRGVLSSLAEDTLALQRVVPSADARERTKVHGVADTPTPAAYSHIADASSSVCETAIAAGPEFRCPPSPFSDITRGGAYEDVCDTIPISQLHGLDVLSAMCQLYASSSVYR